MDDGFEGFGPTVFAWFAGLERDNSKAYFTEIDVVGESLRTAPLIAWLGEHVGPSTLPPEARRRGRR
jgi:hypothetical protein